MSTLADVTTPAASGLNHIDAVLDTGPGWNWLAPARNVLYYSFSLGSGNAKDQGVIYTGATSAFSAIQQTAAEQALARVTQVTGIRFQATADGAAADLHFANANVVGATTSGYASTLWSYRYDAAQLITSYTADAWIYIDNVEYAASNVNPTVGSRGFELFLHELGHAMGLKHSFQGTVTLPAAQDNTSNTLMSYTHQGGPYSDFSPYDVAALKFLYGGDGLGGALGQGGAGIYLVGTGGSDNLAGGPGNDRFEPGAGNDTLSGGAGLDTVAYSHLRGAYTVQRSAGDTWTVQSLDGSDGRDTLGQVERLVFGDQALAFDLSGSAGTTARYLGAVFGRDAVARTDYVGIGLTQLDGGTSAAALMQLALNARLGTGFSRESLVEVIYTNLVGSAPGAADLAHWVGTLATGQYTPVTLAQMAASLDLNAQNIDLAGLADHGLAYNV